MLLPRMKGWDMQSEAWEASWCLFDIFGGQAEDNSVDVFCSGIRQISHSRNRDEGDSVGGGMIMHGGSGKVLLVKIKWVEMMASPAVLYTVLAIGEAVYIYQNSILYISSALFESSVYHTSLILMPWTKYIVEVIKHGSPKGIF